MRLPAQRLQQPLQRVQRSARVTHNLTATAQDMQLVEAASIDDNDIAIILAVWSRAFRQAGIRGLHNDDLAGGYAGLKNLPELKQSAWKNNGLGLTSPRSKPRSVPFGPTGVRVHMTAPDNCNQAGNEGLPRHQNNPRVWLRDAIGIVAHGRARFVRRA